jgi:hypothetical protein
MQDKSVKQVLKENMHKLQLEQFIGHAENSRNALLVKQGLLEKYLADED